jgi:hypothetical protein
MTAFSGLLLLACDGGTGPGDGPSLVCDEASTEALAVGELRILDPTQTDACVRLPAAGPEGAEHLYVAVATAARETQNGISAEYSITGSAPAVAAPPALPSPRLSAFAEPGTADAFHRMLRDKERTLAADPTRALFDEGAVVRRTTPPPLQGEQRVFNVCATRQCRTFLSASATAKVVGERVAIFVDNEAPAGGYTDADLIEVGTLFDDHLYPIDTLAFGAESDVDANGVVIVLLTHRVNALAPGCNSSGSVILGYFFGADLLPRGVGNPGSNEAEIFYGLVPDPDNFECDISREFARSRLPATFIHEFQHMISFNQHVLLRDGTSEDTWLNEGLSHLAEELGGRRTPNTSCPVSGSCAHDFIESDLENAFEYLTAPEEHFLIEPSSSAAELPERGANWLFVRWLVDHFAGDSVLGTDLTRRLVATRLVGAPNVEAQVGVGLDILLPEWQLTNYLDDLPGFDQPSLRLRYKTWNFRQASDSMARPSYPLTPDVTDGSNYSHSGVLRAGSGRHVLVTQSAGAAAVDLRLTGGSEAVPVSAAVEARIGLVRIR